VVWDGIEKGGRDCWRGGRGRERRTRWIRRLFPRQSSGNGQSFERRRFVQNRPPPRPREQVSLPLVRRITRYEEHLRRYGNDRPERRRDNQPTRLFRGAEP